MPGCVHSPVCEHSFHPRQVRHASHAIVLGAEIVMFITGSLQLAATMCASLTGQMTSVQGWQRKACAIFLSTRGIRIAAPLCTCTHYRALLVVVQTLHVIWCRGHRLRWAMLHLNANDLLTR